MDAAEVRSSEGDRHTPPEPHPASDETSAMSRPPESSGATTTQTTEQHAAVIDNHDETTIAAAPEPAMAEPTDPHNGTSPSHEGPDMPPSTESATPTTTTSTQTSSSTTTVAATSPPTQPPSRDSHPPPPAQQHQRPAPPPQQHPHRRADPMQRFYITNNPSIEFEPSVFPFLKAPLYPIAFTAHDLDPQTHLLKLPAHLVLGSGVPAPPPLALPWEEAVERHGASHPPVLSLVLKVLTHMAWGPRSRFHDYLAALGAFSPPHIPPPFRVGAALFGPEDLAELKGTSAAGLANTRFLETLHARFVVPYARQMEAWNLHELEALEAREREWRERVRAHQALVAQMQVDAAAAAAEEDARRVAAAAVATPASTEPPAAATTPPADSETTVSNGSSGSGSSPPQQPASTRTAPQPQLPPPPQRVRTTSTPWVPMVAPQMLYDPHAFRVALAIVLARGLLFPHAQDEDEDEVGGGGNAVPALRTGRGSAAVSRHCFLEPMVDDHVGEATGDPGGLLLEAVVMAGAGGGEGAGVEGDARVEWQSAFSTPTSWARLLFPCLRKDRRSSPAVRGRMVLVPFAESIPRVHCKFPPVGGKGRGHYQHQYQHHHPQGEPFRLSPVVARFEQGGELWLVRVAGSVGEGEAGA
ncbi:hypothetical protein HDU96_004345, partial [Phlyctochytrium bullatum]